MTNTVPNTLRQILQNCGSSLRAKDFKALLDYLDGIGGNLDTVIEDVKLLEDVVKDLIETVSLMTYDHFGGRATPSMPINPNLDGKYSWYITDTPGRYVNFGTPDGSITSGDYILNISTQPSTVGNDFASNLIPNQGVRYLFATNRFTGQPVNMTSLQVHSSNPSLASISMWGTITTNAPTITDEPIEFTVSDWTLPAMTGRLITRVVNHVPQATPPTLTAQDLAGAFYCIVPDGDNWRFFRIQTTRILNSLGNDQFAAISQAAVTQTVNDINQLINILQQTVNQLNTDLTNAINTINGRITSEVNILNTRINTTNTNVTSNTNAINNINNTVTVIEEELLLLAAMIDALGGGGPIDLTQVFIKLNEISDELTDIWDFINENVDRLNTDVETLLGLVSDIEGRLDEHIGFRNTPTSTQHTVAPDFDNTLPLVLNGTAGFSGYNFGWFPASNLFDLIGTVDGVPGVFNNASNSMSVGRTTSAVGGGVVFGVNSQAGLSGVAIGMNTGAEMSTAIGQNVHASFNATAIGQNVESHLEAVGIGMDVISNGGFAIGRNINANNTTQITNAWVALGQNIGNDGDALPKIAIGERLRGANPSIQEVLIGTNIHNDTTRAMVGIGRFIHSSLSTNDTTSVMLGSNIMPTLTPSNPVNARICIGRNISSDIWDGVCIGSNIIPNAIMQPWGSPPGRVFIGSNINTLNGWGIGIGRNIYTGWGNTVIGEYSGIESINNILMGDYITGTDDLNWGGEQGSKFSSMVVIGNNNNIRRGPYNNNTQNQAPDVIAIGNNSYNDFTHTDDVIRIGNNIGGIPSFTGNVNHPIIIIGHNTGGLSNVFEGMGNVLLGDSRFTTGFIGHNQIQTISLSDERDKINIEPLKNSLDFICKLDAIKYNLNTRTRYNFNLKLKRDSPDKPLTPQDIENNTIIEKRGFGEIGYDKVAHASGIKADTCKSAGLSAQEIEKALEEVYGDKHYVHIVRNSCAEDKLPEGVESRKSVDYEQLIPFLIESIKILKSEIDELKK